MRISDWSLDVCSSDLLAPPRLGEGAYRDRPAVRPDDWPRDARSIDARLASPTDESSDADDGGLQQQRHPGLPEPRDPSPERGGIDPNAAVSEDTDMSAEQRAMDQEIGREEWRERVCQYG